MTHRRPLLVAMGLATLFATALSANHSWGNYHWARTSNQFTLKVGANVSSVWTGSLTGAISDWSQSSVMNLVQVAGGTRPRNCRATAGRIEVCSERYGRNGWLGIAQIWVAGDHITQATTKVNDTYFSPNYAGGYYNTSAWRNFVMCQEIGHDFGLDHQDENFDNPPLGSCMDYSDPPDANQHPNAHDYEQLEIIYSHLDSTSTVDQSAAVSKMPPAMGQINFEGPEQWGRLVHSNANGRIQIFELDFGGGNKVLTHVLWADPADARR